MRAAIYARYSSENQRDASIEDQVRICEARLEQEGWTSAATYTDHAMSGASALRPGYQKLLEDARRGAFEIVVAEALDRLSRDLSDVAALHKHLSFLSIRLVTFAEGEIGDLQVGLKGTMNALFLKDLAQKTRRGLEGRVRLGRSGGGLCYGYTVVQGREGSGEPERGLRVIDEDEATIVRRIFQEFATGRSPRAIAVALNAEGIPGPRGAAWGPSTIYGNWRRGTGILNNELYVGRLVWNRQRFVKDPATGKRVARPNPQKEWIINDVPELRIVSQDLWDRVKGRQQKTRRAITEDEHQVRSERARRPAYLLSGLIRCGVCSGGMSIVSAGTYGCSNARNRGTCNNLLTIRREVLEESVLGGLRTHLMHPDLVKEFIAEYHREINRLAAMEDDGRARKKRELVKVEADISQIIEAVKAGMRTDAMAEELHRLEDRKVELRQALEAKTSPPVRLHPNLAEVYSKKVEDLRGALSRPDTRAEAANILRGLIDEIHLAPVDGTLQIRLVGDLAGILGFSATKNPGSKEEAGAGLTLVAGARNHL